MTPVDAEVPAGVSATDGLVVGRGLPAYLLRVAILVVGFAVVTVLLQEGVKGGTFLLLVPALLASVYAPASPAPAGVVIVAAGLAAVGGGDPLRVEILMLIPLVHLFHVLCGLAGTVPATGRVHLRGLRPPALRFLLIQAIMAALVTLAALLPTDRTEPLFEAVALVGLAAIALVIVWLQRVK